LRTERFQTWQTRRAQARLHFTEAGVFHQQRFLFDRVRGDRRHSHRLAMSRRMRDTNGPSVMIPLNNSSK